MKKFAESVSPLQVEDSTVVIELLRVMFSKH